LDIVQTNWVPIYCNIIDVFRVSNDECRLELLLEPKCFYTWPDRALVSGTYDPRQTAKPLTLDVRLLRTVLTCETTVTIDRRTSVTQQKVAWRSTGTKRAGWHTDGRPSLGKTVERGKTRRTDNTSSSASEQNATTNDTRDVIVRTRFDFSRHRSSKQKQNGRGGRKKKKTKLILAG